MTTITLDTFVKSVRKQIILTYFSAQNWPICYVQKSARPTVTPLYIWFPLTTGTTQNGTRVMVSEVTAKKYEEELNEKVGTIFRSYLRLTGGDVRAVPAAPVQFTRSPLGIQIPNPETPAAIPWRAIPDAGAWNIPVGVTYDAFGEELIYWRREEGDAHAIIAGATRSGKSTQIQNMVAHLVSNESPEDIEIVAVDLKRRALVALEDAPHVRQPLAYTKEQALATLVALDAEQNRRIEQLVDYPILFVVIDELTDVLEGDEVAQSIFSRIARKGAELNIVLLVGTQKPMTTEIGQGNSQLNKRLVGRMQRARDAKLVAGEDIDTSRLRHAGSFYIVDGKGDPLLVRAPYISSEQFARVVADARHRWPTPSPSVLDIETPEQGATGKSITHAQQRQAQAEEDARALLDKFGQEGIEDASWRKRIEAIGLKPSGTEWRKGKDRVTEAMRVINNQVTT